MHYKISSHSVRFGWLVTDLLTVQTFDFYALVYFILSSITMSVAFTPHRQRGKGDITPAGIQKVIHLSSASQNGGYSIRLLAARLIIVTVPIQGWLNRSETILQGQSAVNMNSAGIMVTGLNGGSWLDWKNWHEIVFEGPWCRLLRAAS